MIFQNSSYICLEIIGQWLSQRAVKDKESNWIQFHGHGHNKNLCTYTYALHAAIRYTNMVDYAVHANKKFLELCFSPFFFIQWSRRVTIKYYDIENLNVSAVWNAFLFSFAE